MHFLKKYTPFYLLGILYVVLNFILRLVLLFHPITQTGFKWYETIKLFVLGLVSDVLVYVIASAVLWLYLLFLSNGKYQKPWGGLLFALFLSLLVYVSFFNTILNEYGGPLPMIGISFIALKTVLFGLLLFLPRWRATIRLVLYSLTLFIFVVVMLQSIISEWFFWNEFGVRYNFIAVDYLVYTNTVIGNIMESYPVVPLFTGVGIAACLITYSIVKRTLPFLNNLPSFSDKIKNLGVYLALFLLGLLLLPLLSKQEVSPNVFVNELQANGFYRFYQAYSNSELDYDQFYKTLPEKEAFAILKKQIPSIEGNTTIREITADSAEIHKNVVLITIESLSADFLTTYGNEQNLTPFLDALSKKSLLFSNLYAVGNRTVRGLESVTMCVPPTAGESVVKRKDNKDKFTTGGIFKQKGYTVNYLYGGDAYFDNMEDFFGGNHYGIVDKKSFHSNEISFSNVWGVCDEDMAKKAIQLMNSEAQSKRPFFNHWMTVSNHRPFTYPDGKIDIDAHSKSREGGVKYTDYALQQFFAMAEKQPWLKNTVFVIVADHCASSAGKTELPLDNYRIPGMIYAPGFVKPAVHSAMISQIDLMPTLFGLLHFKYKSKFYGQDVFNADYHPRALIATYQDLGLIKDNVLTVISPRQKVKQFKLTQHNNAKLDSEFEIHYEQKPLSKERKDLVKATISYYQTASHLLKNKQLNQ